jgi:hypothetical protein
MAASTTTLATLPRDCLLIIVAKCAGDDDDDPFTLLRLSWVCRALRDVLLADAASLPDVDALWFNAFVRLQRASGPPEMVAMLFRSMPERQLPFYVRRAPGMSWRADFLARLRVRCRCCRARPTPFVHALSPAPRPRLCVCCERNKASCRLLTTASARIDFGVEEEELLAAGLPSIADQAPGGAVRRAARLWLRDDVARLASERDPLDPRVKAYEAGRKLFGLVRENANIGDPSYWEGRGDEAWQRAAMRPHLRAIENAGKVPQPLPLRLTVPSTACQEGLGRVERRKLEEDDEASVEAAGGDEAAEEQTATTKRRRAEQQALEEAERAALETQIEVDRKFRRRSYSALVLPSEVETLGEAAAAPAATGSGE